MKPLRIFYASHASPHADGIPGSLLWYQNLFLSLVDLGHDVVPFDYDLTPHFQNLDPAHDDQRRFIERNRPTLETELLRQVRGAHRQKPIDVFFSYFYSACARPEVIREIRGLDITTVNWYCNGSYQFHLVKEIAPAYDWCLVPEEFRLEDYRRIGARPIYTQEAANPAVYKPYPLPVEYDIVFVGQRYGDRPVFIRRLLDAGIEVRVWGPGWLAPAPPLTPGERWKMRISALRKPEGWRAAGRRLRRMISGAPPPPEQFQIPAEICGPPLSDEDLVKMYSRAKISLGFSSCGETHVGGERVLQVRLRDFEAPMSGAFYMVEYMPELEHFFEIGKEVVCYANPDDLVDKVRYYLEHDDERERIRRAGFERARRDHTWQRRFEDAFRQMGFD